jgi:hypothetical protein
LLFNAVDLGCTILKNYVFSLTLKLGKYTPYLLSVIFYSRKKERKKEKNSKAQALACLMSIVLSFVYALCY